ncbi:MAG: hypothetical protein Ct9H90mP26_0440 [Methanobacteriota archaeon]|nr:MAG: hypothetical protein Ct9H90mP26_0440 [Euryarchaeota archaeon]
MPISTGDILGHSQVGVYLSVVGDVLFIPSTLEDEIATRLSHHLIWNLIGLQSADPPFWGA